MLEELQPQLPDDQTPGKDTPVEGTDSVPEDGSSDESSEGKQVHPNGDKKPEGDEEVFHKEGTKVFKTKDEYIQHVNRQRGAASRLAHKYNELERDLAETRRKLEAIESGKSGAPANRQEQQEEFTEEFKQAVANLRKAGMVTREELETILKPLLSKYDRAVSQIESQELTAAEQVVGEFLDLNPDAVDHITAMQDVLKRAENAGIPMDVYKAYYHVTGKLPKTKEATTSKQVVREVKRAQAGGKSSGNGSGAASKGEDFFDYNF